MTEPNQNVAGTTDREVVSMRILDAALGTGLSRRE